LSDTLIIAEVGSVHDGSFGNALKLIEAAAATGVDCVKFQTHISEAETLPNAPMPPYFKGEPRFEYFKRTGFSESQWKEIKACCEEQDVEFISSPFSEEAVELLENVGIHRYKIPSGEVTNLPMLALIAQTGKPVILSSGMSSWLELDAAVETTQRYTEAITVLQCTSEYPVPYENVGLNIMLEMQARYGLPVGLSDHTLTIYAPIAAVTLGATVIEKHFTFSRLMYGSDARHSPEPDEFTDMVKRIRAAEIMRDTQTNKNALAESLQDMKNIFEKSVVTVVNIPAGTMITRAMLGIKKPGTGIPAQYIDQVVGRVAVHDIAPDQLLREEDLNEVIGG